MRSKAMFVLNIAAITSLPAEQFTEVEVRVGAIIITTCRIDLYVLVCTCMYLKLEKSAISLLNESYGVIVCTCIYLKLKKSAISLLNESYGAQAIACISYFISTVWSQEAFNNLTYYYPVNVKINCANHYDKSNLEQRNLKFFKHSWISNCKCNLNKSTF